MRLPLAAACLILARTASAQVVIDRFSSETEAEGQPKGWKRMEFKKVASKTAYSIDRDGEEHFVRAVSSANGTGLLKEVAVNLKEHPYLTWRWKVSNILKTADLREKKGDDYPARVYVAFLYDPAKAGVFKRWKYRAAKAKFGGFPPESALIYVWDNAHPLGEVYDNAYVNMAKMVIVESGAGKVGSWASEKRNVYEDYKAAFGAEPPPVSFVALMTDTDNTGEAATGWYDDLVFSAE